MSSRRNFLKIASLATAYAATRGTALAAADEPALGLIFPPLNYPIPPDAKRLYPAGVLFLSDGVGLVTTVRGRLGCKKALRIAFAQFCRNCSRELGFGAQTDELGWSFISRCDGKRTVGDVLREVASNSGLNADSIKAGAMHVIRHLIQHGFLQPAELPAHTLSRATCNPT